MKYGLLMSSFVSDACVEVLGETLEDPIGPPGAAVWLPIETRNMSRRT